MAIDTQKLRELIENVNAATEAHGETDWYAPPGVLHIDPDGIGKADFDFIAYLSPERATAILDHIDAQEAEIDALRANLEHHQAYWITHRGAALVCSSVVRDAYSDEKVRADAAEAAIERLSDALSIAREFIATSRAELVVTHGINGVIPADDTLGLAGVADCDAILGQIDAALSGEGK